VCQFLPQKVEYQVYRASKSLSALTLTCRFTLKFVFGVACVDFENNYVIACDKNESLNGLFVGQREMCVCAYNHSVFTYVQITALVKFNLNIHCVSEKNVTLVRFVIA